MNIIINADDFGLNYEINQRIQYFYNKGIISSASIIANSEYFDQAISIAKNNPGLGVGVHLCLDGPFNMIKENCSLINPDNGQFYDHLNALRRLKWNKFLATDMFKEYDMQIQKISDHGINITHLDHHHHFHLYFQSLRQVLKIAKKYRIRSIRSQQILVPFKRFIFNKMYRFVHQSFVNRSLITTDGFFEILPLTVNHLHFNFNRLNQVFQKKYRTIEIVCHPNDETDIDTYFLDNPEFKKLLADHNIINYAHL